jgi:phosphatidylethanolamine/phosphatidyl-N-methylethanolamine N-methyltransferase
MGDSLLRQWLKTPAMVGALLPSSRHLAKAMARHAGETDALVELGAGTGTITRELVRQHPDTPLILFEQNSTLANRLRSHFTHAEIIAECFHQLDGNPQRRLIQFTYQPRAPFRAPAGLAWRRYVTVWRNAPPAGIWELSTPDRHSRNDLAA